MEFVPGEQVALVNGQPVDMGVPSFLENSRILVPARFLAEQLGRRISWTGDPVTVDMDS